MFTFTSILTESECDDNCKSQLVLRFYEKLSWSREEGRLGASAPTRVVLQQQHEHSREMRTRPSHPHTPPESPAPSKKKEASPIRPLPFGDLEAPLEARKKPAFWHAHFNAFQCVLHEAQTFSSAES